MQMRAGRRRLISITLALAALIWAAVITIQLRTVRREAAAANGRVALVELAMLKAIHGLRTFDGSAADVADALTQDGDRGFPELDFARGSLIITAHLAETRRKADALIREARDQRGGAGE